MLAEHWHTKLQRANRFLLVFAVQCVCSIPPMKKLINVITYYYINCYLLHKLTTSIYIVAKHRQMHTSIFRGLRFPHPLNLTNIPFYLHNIGSIDIIPWRELLARSVLRSARALRLKFYCKVPRNGDVHDRKTRELVIVILYFENKTQMFIRLYCLF